MKVYVATVCYDDNTSDTEVFATYDLAEAWVQEMYETADLCFTSGYTEEKEVITE